LLGRRPSQQSQGWPIKPRVRLVAPRWVLAAAFITCMTLIILGPVTGLVDQEAFEHPIELRARALLGRHATLGPKIKVFALDNSTYAKLRTPWLEGSLWAKILAGLGDAQPSAILTSHMFGASEFRDSQLGETLKNLRTRGVNVYAGAFPWSGVIRHRAPLSVSAESHAARHWTGDEGTIPSTALHEMRSISADWREFQLYGMTAEEASHFAGIGHVDYRGDGKIQPLARLQGDRYVAHLSLFAASTRRVSEETLLLNGRPIPMTGNDPLLIDFVATSEILAKARSIDSLLQRMDAGSLGEIVQPGDIVYIATDLYTGRTTFVPTPLGPIPGSLVMVSAINGVVENRWIRELPGGTLPLVLGTIFGAGIGAFLGWAMSSSGAVIAIGLVLVMFASTGILSTSLLALSLPWLMPSMACLIVGLAVTTKSSWIRRLKTEEDRVAAAAETGKFSAIIRTAQMLAHDIRRPFSIIDTTVKGLQSEADPHRIKRLLTKLAPDLERAKQSVEVMIGDILEIDRASKPRMTPRAPGEVLAVSLRDSMIRLQPADITIKSHFEHTLRINIDEPKIRRTLCNIIENAVEAMNNSGTLWIKTSDEWRGTKSWVKIAIGNDGPWIPPEARERIFDAFWTSSKSKGTGLGLALAKKVVESHGGQIGCSSESPNSTEFWMILPAVWDTPIRERSTIPKHSREIIDDKLHSAHQTRVAVIDDSAFMLEAWMNALSGTTVSTFTSPEAFLKACHDDAGFLPSLDIIILDYFFGEESADNGLVLAGRIKSMRQIPIVLCTDWPVTDAVVSVVTDAQISKEPMSLRAIQNLLRRPQMNRLDQEA
jgi:signal transduction histidine kinase